MKGIGRADIQRDSSWLVTPNRDTLMCLSTVHPSIIDHSSINLVWATGHDRPSLQSTPSQAFGSDAKVATCGKRETLEKRQYTIQYAAVGLLLTDSRPMCRIKHRERIFDGFKINNNNFQYNTEQ